MNKNDPIAARRRLMEEPRLAWFRNRELGFDASKLNVNGGAIALGHPIGCTGVRITTTLLHELNRRQVKLGLATLCVSGGMGLALLVERV